MLKDDLALRGNIDTTELLIFASNTLSKNFQGWNMFHFLWGIFRVRGKDALNLPPNVYTHTVRSNVLYITYKEASEIAGCSLIGAFSKWIDAAPSELLILPPFVDILNKDMRTLEDTAAAASVVFKYICEDRNWTVGENSLGHWMAFSRFTKLQYVGLVTKFLLRTHCIWLKP
ncbi:hypothetical protein ABZP36_032641 [Zizania latifolia]